MTYSTTLVFRSIFSVCNSIIHHIYTYTSGGNKTIDINTSGTPTTNMSYSNIESDSTLANNSGGDDSSTMTCDHNSDPNSSNTNINNNTCIQHNDSVTPEPSTGNTTPPTDTINNTPTNTTTSTNNTTTTTTTLLFTDPYTSITYTNWQNDILPYKQPCGHNYARCSSLRLIGFPVDHDAMVWCHQVLQTVTKALIVLSTDTTTSTPTTNTNTAATKAGSISGGASGKGHNYDPSPAEPNKCYKLHELVDLKDTYKNITNNIMYNDYIIPIQHIIHQNNTLYTFKQSIYNDYIYFINTIYKAIPLIFNINPESKAYHPPENNMTNIVQYIISNISSVCIIYITQYTYLIILVYYIISICILIVPVLRGLLATPTTATTTNNNNKVNTNNKNNNNNINNNNTTSNIAYNTYELLQPHIHLFYNEILCKKVFIYYIILLYILTLLSTYFGFLPYILPYTFTLSQLQRGFTLVFYICISYGIVLFIRILLYISIYIISYTINRLVDFWRIIIRMTIWCKRIRQYMRLYVIKSFKKVYTNNINSIYIKYPILYKLYTIFISYIELFIILTIVTITSKVIIMNKAGNQLFSTLTYMLNIGCVSGFVCLLYEYMLTIYSITHTSSTLIPIHNRNPLFSPITLVLTYTPTILYAIPTFIYSYTLLYSMNSMYIDTSYVLLQMFDVERIHYCMAVYAVALHMRAARR